MWRETRSTRTSAVRCTGASPRRAKSTAAKPSSSTGSSQRGERAASGGSPGATEALMGLTMTQESEGPAAHSHDEPVTSAPEGSEEVEAQDAPDGLEAILDADLLAL